MKFTKIKENINFLAEQHTGLIYDESEEMKMFILHWIPPFSRHSAFLKSYGRIFLRECGSDEDELIIENSVGYGDFVYKTTFKSYYGFKYEYLCLISKYTILRSFQIIE